MKASWLVAVSFLVYTTIAVAQPFRLPFDGRWFVMQGGDTLNVNEHMRVPAQQYGIDFAKVDGVAGRSLVRTNGAKTHDYYSWDASVLAPSDGEVITVVDSLPDNEIGTKDGQNPAGNFITIKTADGQFVFLAHFQLHTIQVKPGEHVAQGQVLGTCGNSGNSDFPHIHMHVQDTPVLNTGTGQNPAFLHMDVELNGKQFSHVDWPLIRGLFVSNH